MGESYLTLVRKPDAGKLHVRFDERDLETEPPGRRARSRLYQFQSEDALKMNHLQNGACFFLTPKACLDMQKLRKSAR